MRRSSPGMFGPSRISWVEIDAFIRQSRFELAPWEIEVIEDLDDAYFRSQAASGSGD